jgi:hypothetical protein
MILVIPQASLTCIRHLLINLTGTASRRAAGRQIRMALLKSVRRRVYSKILRFSLAIGTFGLALAGVLFATAFYPSVRQSQRVNREALASIKCGDSQCDTAALSLNWGPEPDYVIDLRNRYFIWAPSSFERRPATLQSFGLCGHKLHQGISGIVQASRGHE